VREVKPIGQRDHRTPEVRVTATKPSPAPLQNYSPGGCTIDMPPSNVHHFAAPNVLFPLSANGSTKNDGLESDGPQKLRGAKMQDLKMADQKEI